jgi:predicted extracellular nuclease
VKSDTRYFLRALCVFAVASSSLATPAFGAAKVVISQVYGGGGNSGATYKNDFVELFNTGDAAQSLIGWSVQYSAATGTGTWQTTALSGTIQPGHYFLVQEAAGANNAAVGLPTPDVSGVIPMAAGAAKVALASGSTAFTGACPAGASLVDFVAYGAVNCSEGSITGATSSPLLTNPTAGFRLGAGCMDSDNNAANFGAAAAPNPRNSSFAANACVSMTSSVTHPEGDSGTTSFDFAVSLNIPAPGNVNLTAGTADVSAAAGSDYTALTSANFSISTGQTSTTVSVLINGDATVEPDETFTLTLSGVSGAGATLPVLQGTGTIQNDDSAAISLSFTPTSTPDTTEGVSYSRTLTVTNGAACGFGSSGTLPPGLVLSFTGTDNLALLAGISSLSGSYAFTVTATCSNGSTSQPYTVAVAFACESGTKISTAIHSVQGGGTSSPRAGQTVELEGIVVGDFQASNQLKGFYLQEPDATWDSDPATSEGLFVFDNLTGADVNIGDRVRVKGSIDEFTSSGSFLGATLTSSLTEIGSLQNKLVCGTGNSYTRTTVSLPVANTGDLERYEGMAVQITQQLTVTGNFSLGTFGQIDLAPALQYVPTAFTGNATTWAAAQSLITRSVIALDDASTLANANLYPTLFPAGGLSASNTLRSGDLLNYDAGTHTNSPLIGVLDDRFGEYRIQPTAAVTFYPANPRPAIAPVLASTASRFRGVSANVLNFFTTLGSRGAATATEFQHQKTKVIEALSAMDGDVYGLSEVQNFNDGQTGSGSNSYTNAALQSIVDGLNCRKAGQDALCTTPPATPYLLVDTLNLGANNGTDAIRTAIVYRSDRLTPVGSPAEYYQNDTNRPSLAQTFQPASGNKAAQQTFTFVVNHFRSKGSACGGANDDPFQGNCNGLRLNMAQNVITWLASNPTLDPAGANRHLLLVGDFNAYYGEDPIQWFGTHGYVNLINAIIGSSAYSYNFGSQAGYLDHTFANAGMNSLVKKVAEWHNNADEPSSLQALGSSAKSAAAQIAYYGADAYAASDHDPIVIGFNTLPGDLNDDGVVNLTDAALEVLAIGKHTTAADRRMDYDGDGVITLNDYRIWANYFKAYLF